MSEVTPQSSPYGYTLGNPVRFSDPTGMLTEENGLITTSTSVWGRDITGNENSGEVLNNGLTDDILLNHNVEEDGDDNGGGLEEQFPYLFGQFGYEGLGNGNGGESSVWTRALGALQAIGGVFEIAAGATISSTGLGAALGLPIGAHGLDNLFAGGSSLWTGKKTRTYTSRGLQYMGLSENQAEMIDLGIGIAGGLFGGYAQTFRMTTVYRGTAFADDIAAIERGYLLSHSMREGVEGATGYLARVRHSLNSRNPASAYVSTSIWKSAAANFAGKHGSIYKFQVPRYKLYSTKYSTFFTGFIEGEYLIKGGTKIHNVTKIR
jgi:hypothetical protein